MALLCHSSAPFSLPIEDFAASAAETLHEKGKIDGVLFARCSLLSAGGRRGDEVMVVVPLGVY